MKEDKRKRIIASAVKVFAKKGFHFTSMQDIAWELGISKGALYLQFTSKEDLLLSIIQYYQDELFEQVACIMLDESRSAKEKLMKQIQVQFTGFHEYRDFIKLQIKEQLNPKSRLVQEFMEKSKARVIYWEKKALLAAYGESIRPFLWDLVLIFHGITGEYRRLILIEKQPIDIEMVSQIIVHCLDGVVASLSKQEKAVVTSEMLPDLDEEEERYPSFEERISCCLQTMKEELNRASVEKGMKQEVVEAIVFLQEELEREQPRGFLLRSVTSYLETIPLIQTEMKRLQRLLTQRYNLK